MTCNKKTTPQLKACTVVFSVVVPLLFLLTVPVDASSLPVGNKSQVCINAADETIQIWRVYYDSTEDLRLLSNFDLLEYNNFLESYVLVAAGVVEINQINALGFQTIIDDFQTSNYRKIALFAPITIDSIAPPYNCYRTVEETYAFALSLATTYPDLVDWIDMGNSWEKSVLQPDGYDLYVLKITNKSIAGPKPVLFMTASIHPREYATVELVNRFADYLVHQYGISADVTWLIDYQEIQLMLVANPDGRKEAEAGVLWRKNTNESYCGPTSSYRGADLNRNFSFQWACCGGSSAMQCSETYHGPTAASELETQAIQTYMRTIFPDQREDVLTSAAPPNATGIYLDIHSYGELVLWPWGFTSTSAPNGTALQTLGRKFAYFNNYTPSQSVGLYPTDGSTEDFAYGDLGVSSFCFEVGTEFFESCNKFEDNILPKNLPAFIYAAKASRTPYITPSGPDMLSLVLSDNSVPAGTMVNLSAQSDDTHYLKAYEDPTQSIVQVEYAIDIPYWSSGYTPVEMMPSDGSFDTSIENVQATLDTTGLSEGRHIIFTRGRDASGAWGAVSAIFLKIEPILNHAPVAIPQQLSIRQNLSLSILLSGSDTDGDELTYVLVDGPSHGRLFGDAPNLTYVPETSFFGTDSFSFIVNDGQVDSAEAIVAIRVDFALYLPITLY